MLVFFLADAFLVLLLRFFAGVFALTLEAPLPLPALLPPAERFRRLLALLALAMALLAASRVPPTLELSTDSCR